MAVWHMMFARPQFSSQQITGLVGQFQQEGNFGGLPITSVAIVRKTQELIYVDLEYELDHGITRPVFENMAKYILVAIAGLAHAPQQLYLSAMSIPFAQLHITYYFFEDHSTDLIFWETLPGQNEAR